jgi:hypothetical protein
MDQNSSCDQPQQEKSSPRPTVGEHGEESLQGNLNDQSRLAAARIESPKTGVARHPFRGGHSSMIPRFSPMVTACVRSFAPNLERMLLR